MGKQQLLLLPLFFYLLTTVVHAGNPAIAYHLSSPLTMNLDNLTLLLNNQCPTSACSGSEASLLHQSAKLSGYYKRLTCSCVGDYEGLSDSLHPSRILVETFPDKGRRFTATSIEKTSGSTTTKGVIRGYYTTSGVLYFWLDTLMCRGVMLDYINGIKCRDSQGSVICSSTWDCYEGECYTTGGFQYARTFIYPIVGLLSFVIVATGAILIRVSLIRTLKVCAVLQGLASLVILWTPLNHIGFANIISSVVIYHSLRKNLNQVLLYTSLLTFMSNGGCNSLFGGIQLGYQKASYEQLSMSFTTNDCFIKYGLPLDHPRCTMLLLTGMWALWIIMLLQVIFILRAIKQMGLF